MNMRDNFNRRLPALKPIRVRPIEPTDPALYRKLSAAEWDALMAAKYGRETSND